MPRSSVTTNHTVRAATTTPATMVSTGGPLVEASLFFGTLLAVGTLVRFDASVPFSVFVVDSSAALALIRSRSWPMLCLLGTAELLRILSGALASDTPTPLPSLTKVHAALLPRGCPLHFPALVEYPHSPASTGDEYDEQPAAAIFPRECKPGASAHSRSTSSY